MAVLETVRTRVLTHPIGSTTGDRLSDFIPAGNVWLVQPPDNPTYPFVVIRCDLAHTDGAYNQQRVEGLLEVLLYARGENNRLTLERATDCVEAALVRYWERTGTSLIFSRDTVRDQFPPPVEPVDRQQVGARVAAQLVYWPQYLQRVDS